MQNKIRNIDVENKFDVDERVCNRLLIDVVLFKLNNER